MHAKMHRHVNIRTVALNATVTTTLHPTAEVLTTNLKEPAAHPLIDVLLHFRGSDKLQGKHTHHS